MQASPGHGSVPKRGGTGLPRPGNLETHAAKEPRRRWTGIAIVLAMIAGCGFGAWEWLAWRESTAARHALAAGRYQEAHDAVERLIRLRLRAAEAQYLRAKTAIALGRRGEYVDGLKQAESLGYPRDRLAVLRALIDAQFGRIIEAQPVLEGAFAEAQEGTPDLMVDEALARVYLDRYDFAHASAVLIRWAVDAPDDPRPPWWRAELNRRRAAEPDIIIADYRETLKRAPGHIEALRGIAKQLDRANLETEAAEAYDALFAIHPDDPEGHLGAGRNATMRGDEAAAASHIDRALALAPDNAPAHVERAKINLRRNELPDALAHLDRAVSLAPFDRDAHYQRSLALKRLGQADESSREQAIFARLTHDQEEREALQERLDASPDDENLQSQLASWMLAHGYDQEGLKWAQKILLEHPGHRETCVVLADYYERIGDWELAKNYRNQVSHRGR
jgi:thioredoxin-like negative regulator of GroEL